MTPSATVAAPAQGTTPSRPWVLRFVGTSIGAKYVMAVTGLALSGFVLFHMLGNLQIFLGQDAMNAYAHFLKSVPELLWGARIFLLLMVIMHVAAALWLTLRNWDARPEPYFERKNEETTLAARTILVSGLVIAAFIVYHLLHFTIGVVHPEHFHLVDEKGRHDVYSMFILGFRHPEVATAYVVAMLLLGVHLKHGVSSFMQTLGWNHPRYNGLIRLAGPMVAFIVVVGNISMPIAVQLGWLTLPGGQ